jgi:hypothetical protein
MGVVWRNRDSAVSGEFVEKGANPWVMIRLMTNFQKR